MNRSGDFIFVSLKRYAIKDPVRTPKSLNEYSEQPLKGYVVKFIMYTANHLNQY